MKILIIISIALMSYIDINAQNTAGKADDMGRIALAAYVPQQIENMPVSARSMLSNKLSQIATQSGMGGSSLNQRFIITANITVLTKDITETAPPMTALTLDVTLYIGDGIEGTKFASSSTTIKGVGENETKAYISAIKNINASNPNYKTFVEEGKTKIISYYNSKCDFIIKEAQTLTSQDKYEEAIFKLTEVPDVCKECYDKCMTAVEPIYKKFMEKQCKIKLAEAKTSWAASQNAEGASAAAAILGTIDPDAVCYKDAMALSTEIGKKIKELDKRDWDFKMKEHNDQVDITKQQINAYREVGVAYGKGQPKSISYNVNGWFR